MAAKSVILRPVGFVNTGEITSVIFPYGGNPDTTAAEDYFLLISEEVADDDTTWVNNGPSNDDLGVILESTDKVPISGRVVARANITTNADYLEIRLLDRANPTTTIYTQNFDIPFVLGEDGTTKNSVWHTYVVEVTDTNALQSFLSAAEPVVVLNASTYGEPVYKTYHTEQLTQLYCEFEYKDGSSYYVKSDGAWAENSGTIYRKSNGVWAEVDASALTEQAYVLQEL